MELRLIWDEILFCGLVGVDQNGTILFWDLEMDKEVVCEYIECYVVISEICAHFSVNF